MDQNIVIIPTFNEIENIEVMIHRVFRLNPDIHILVVDDNSPDGTGKKVDELMEIYPDQLYLLERSEKSGLGTAYIAGFKWALDRDYEYILEMDADFSHNPKHIQRLLDKIREGYDIVVGSRYVKSGRIMNWPLDRRILSYGGSLYARLITPTGVKDPTSGFVCYHRDCLSSINLDKISSIGYSFQIEMKYAAKKLGKTLSEVPITFIDRQRGESKMNGSIIKEAALGVIRMRLQEPNYYRSEIKIESYNPNWIK